MSSSFFGFSIGVKALAASQKALEVLSHNIANMNTEGYKRQDVILKTSIPAGNPAINRHISAGQIGSGVDVGEIRRMHDHYIERQMNEELQNSGKWEAGINIFEQIESIFAEPSENGIRSMMDTYWNSWRDLESMPEDYSIRKSLVENSKSLSSFLRGTYQKFMNLRRDLNTEINIKVTDINVIADQIKDLNALIKKVSIGGDNPNDLMDKRDLLINKLNKMINVDVRDTDYNQVDIFIGGTAIVRENNYFELEASLPVSGYYEVVWKDSARPVEINNGEIYSMLNFRDNYIPDLITRLDNIAEFLINQTNAIHSTGFGLDGVSTGYDYFTGTGVTDIDVNTAFDNNLVRIAAAKNANQPGDNSNTADILNLRNLKLLAGGTNTTDESYNNMIVKVGVEAQQSIRQSENSSLLINRIYLKQESVSGVSLDEELVNMVKYQHSYNAAAKIINAMDELFETIIREMG